jgi:hypothetical protein
MYSFIAVNPENYGSGIEGQNNLIIMNIAPLDPAPRLKIEAVQSLRPPQGQQGQETVTATLRKASPVREENTALLPPPKRLHFFPVLLPQRRFL